MKYLIFLILLAGCATAPKPLPEPIVVTKEVKVPTLMKCVPDNYDPNRPIYADIDAALKAAVDAAERYQLLWAGRAQRQAREHENEIVIAGCK